VGNFHVTIEEGIVELATTDVGTFNRANGVFDNLGHLLTIQLPSTLELIGSLAF